MIQHECDYTIYYQSLISNTKQTWNIHKKHLLPTELPTDGRIEIKAFGYQAAAGQFVACTKIIKIGAHFHENHMLSQHEIPNTEIDASGIKIMFKWDVESLTTCKYRLGCRGNYLFEMEFDDYKTERELNEKHPNLVYLLGYQVNDKWKLTNQKQSDLKSGWNYDFTAYSNIKIVKIFAYDPDKQYFIGSTPNGI